MNIFKKLQIILVVILCLSLSMLFVACDPGDGDTPPDTGITVTFNTNGGSSIASDVLDAEFIMPSKPTREGYVFVGWYFDQGFTQSASNAEILAKTESFTLYAKWQKVPVVTFDSQGGSAVASDLLDQDFAMPTAPTKAGYHFDGWYFDQACTQIATYRRVCSWLCTNVHQEK